MAESKNSGKRYIKRLADGMGPEEARIMAECDVQEYRGERGSRERSKSGPVAE